MIPALNQILFLLSTLFGLNTVLVAEETKLILDLESRTGTIEYVDLKTPNQAAEYAEEGLNKIDKAVKFNEHFTQLKLNSKNIEKKDGKLNVRLTFSFTDQNTLLKLLRFNLTHYGEDTPSDSLSYNLLPSENSIKSNGAEKKTKDDIVIRWSIESKVIELDIKQGENAKELMGGMKSIAEYWRE